MKYNYPLLLSILILCLASCSPSKSGDTDANSESGDTTPVKIAEFDRNQGIELLEFDGSQIPTQIQAAYEGAISMGERWNDKNGENFLILTETDTKETPTADGDIELEAALYGYHFVRQGDSIKLLWDIYDFVKECPFDLSLGHIQRSLTITDLDENGYAETTFIYRLACRSDVSPSTMKLMLHENGQKYALRGNSSLSFESKEGDEGDFTPDPSFEKAPEAFLTHAKKLWKEFMIEF